MEKYHFKFVERQKEMHLRHRHEILSLGEEIREKYKSVATIDDTAFAEDFRNTLENIHVLQYLQFAATNMRMYRTIKSNIEKYICIYEAKIAEDFAKLKKYYQNLHDRVNGVSTDASN